MAQGDRVVTAAAEIATRRLVLRRPTRDDAPAIFERYASDPEVGRYLAWPVHRSIEDTEAFLEFSDTDWARWPAGPFLVYDAAGGRLLGSTGLAFESEFVASTGYVLAADVWGRGYATEALLAMTGLAGELGVRRLYACVHPDHLASRRVLEKAGFEREAVLTRFCEFPNLAPGTKLDALCYACDPAAPGS